MTGTTGTISKEDFDTLQQRSDERLYAFKSSKWIVGGRGYAGCFSILLSSLGVQKKDEDICAALPDRRAPLTLMGLLNSFANVGYITRSIPANIRNLDKRLMPCLFLQTKDILNDAMPYVVLSKENDKIFIYDSEQGKIRALQKNEVSQGNIWFFLPEDKVEDCLSKETRKTTNAKWFRTLVERFKSVFWHVFALSVIINILALAVPLFVMFVYDKVISSHAIETLLPLLLGVAVAVGSEFFLKSIRARALSWFTARLDYIVGVNIFERLMLMPAIFTERASISSQISRIKAFDAVRDFFTSSLFLSIVELPFTIVLFAAIIILSGPVVFVPITMSILYLALLFFAHRRIKREMALSGKASSERQQMVIDTFDKIEGVHTGGLSNAWIKQFREISGKTSLHGFEASYTSAVVNTLSHAIYIIAGMSVLIWGIERVWAGSMTSGALIATMILSWRALSPIQTFCTSFSNYEQLKKAVSQIDRLMDIDTEKKSLKTSAALEQLKGSVAFSKVGLRYTKVTDPVFAGLSFNVKPGQLVAITGNNGAGKSTVLKLINGLYRPQAGAILIDGIDIRQMNPLKLRQNIAYVSQTPDIFSGTIAENLRFASPLASDDALVEALTMTGGMEYVEQLPKGFETCIGERKKRQDGVESEPVPEIFYYHISLARAYLKETPIMLFDELPYSFLNSKAGENFQSILKKWKGVRTVFIVTHRDDYIALADQVLLLRKGVSPLVGRPDQISDVLYSSYEVVDD